MHIIITDAWMAKSRPVHLSGFRLLLAAFAFSIGVFVAGMGLYHWVFLTGVQAGWPGFVAVAELAAKTGINDKDRYVRENLDALAQRVGELQGKLAQMEVLSQRVAGLTGIATKDIAPPLGKGGALIADRSFTLEELDQMLRDLDQVSNTRNDYLTVVETTLFEQKLKKMMLPTQHPVANATLGSRFGWRIDPFTGRAALHSGLDFAGPQGTPIVAAAGGVVVVQEFQPAYGNVIEIDHGNDLVTRYAHMHRMIAKKGDLVKRGQKIGEIGTTGRSTGPHLHFEVMVSGQLQDPMQFLTAGESIKNLPQISARGAFKK
jgi:murein DD-endopeptidase MepM/ murein hydrolase activator NlpD